MGTHRGCSQAGSHGWGCTLPPLRVPLGLSSVQAPLRGCGGPLCPCPSGCPGPAVFPELILFRQGDVCLAPAFPRPLAPGIPDGRGGPVETEAKAAFSASAWPASCVPPARQPSPHVSAIPPRSWPGNCPQGSNPPLPVVAPTPGKPPHWGDSIGARGRTRGSLPTAHAPGWGVPLPPVTSALRPHLLRVSLAQGSPSPKTRCPPFLSPRTTKNHLRQPGGAMHPWPGPSPPTQGRPHPPTHTLPPAPRVATRRRSPRGSQLSDRAIGFRARRRLRGGLGGFRHP